MFYDVMLQTQMGGASKLLGLVIWVIRRIL